MKLSVQVDVDEAEHCHSETVGFEGAMDELHEVVSILLNAGGSGVLVAATRFAQKAEEVLDVEV